MVSLIVLLAMRYEKMLQRKGIRYEAGQIAKVWDCTPVIEPSCKFPAL